MFGTQHQPNAVGSSVGLVLCLITSAIVESQSLAQDVASVAESQAAPDSRPPAFANNDPFHNITVKVKISDRFEIYDPHSVEQLQAIRDMGFRQAILDWPNLHREATQLGLDVVMSNRGTSVARTSVAPKSKGSWVESLFPTNHLFCFFYCHQTPSLGCVVPLLVPYLCWSQNDPPQLYSHPTSAPGEVKASRVIRRFGQTGVGKQFGKQASQRSIQKATLR